MTTADVLSPEVPVQTVTSNANLKQYKEAFARDGFVILRNAIPRAGLTDLCSKILDALDRAKSNGTLFSGGGTLSGHLNCSPGEASRFVYTELQQAGVLDVITALAPKATGVPNVGCNVNLPNSVAQHYHADGLFVEDFIVTNVALLETTLENGAIDVLPGTHERFYPYWRFALERTPRLSKRLPMSPGDVLIRTSNLWHRGMPNRTGRARPMLCLRWDNAKNPPDYDPFRESNGEIEFQPNWYKANLLGRLRERTFVTAPVTYSAYRFVSSLVGNKGYATW